MLVMSNQIKSNHSFNSALISSIPSYLLVSSVSIRLNSKSHNDECKLKVHFVIHSLIPLFFSQKIEIFIPIEAFKYILFKLKTFLVNLLVWRSNCRICIFHVDMEIPTYSGQCNSVIH